LGISIPTTSSSVDLVIEPGIVFVPREIGLTRTAQVSSGQSFGATDFSGGQWEELELGIASTCIGIGGTFWYLYASVWFDFDATYVGV